VVNCSTTQKGYWEMAHVTIARSNAIEKEKIEEGTTTIK